MLPTNRFLSCFRGASGATVPNVAALHLFHSCDLEDSGTEEKTYDHARLVVAYQCVTVFACCRLAQQQLVRLQGDWVQALPQVQE